LWGDPHLFYEQEFLPLRELKTALYGEELRADLAAAGLVPPAVEREKFGFRAPGTPYLLKRRLEWIEDLLSYDRIAAQGYFDPATVEKLKEQYRQPGVTLHPHLEIDLLMIVLSFGILVDHFKLPVARSTGSLGSWP
jgi:asparagine synthase (glutamine-hydrolysing)